MNRILLLQLLWVAACGLLGGKEPPFHEQADLVFSRGGSICLMNTETGQTRFWAEGGSPRWSPDGERIAFTGLYKGWEAYQIFVMDVDGTDKRLVSLWEHNGELEPSPATTSGPVWSPDGIRIAYSRCNNCEGGGINYEVYIIALDTTAGLKETRVTENLYYDSVEDWTPDGSKLIIKSDERIDGGFNDFGNIYKINPDGSGKQLILEGDSTFGVGGPRYSSDGSHIAFIGGRNETDEIYIVDSDGSNLRQITDNDLNKRYVSWLPDGSGLVVVMGPEGDYHFQERPDHIYTIDRDGTDLRRLTNEPAEYYNPYWRPGRE